MSAPRIRGFAIGLIASLMIVAAGRPVRAVAPPDRFERTGSKAQYIHRIHLYDAQKRPIDPASPDAPPYSPANTCGKCHDYEAISHGWHFNAPLKKTDGAGRPGEPWIWTDERTGTQIPLSYRGWKGLFTPDELSMSPAEFVKNFGKYTPGGGAGELIEAPKPADGAAPAAAGGAAAQPAPEPQKLVVDCMICHSRRHNYSFQVWAEEVDKGDYAAAPLEALGIGHVETAGGKVHAVYDLTKFDKDKKVFFDVIRRPPNDACYACHSTRRVGPEIPPDWVHDNDVHIKAGLLCADCHRNGIGHETVRGFPGEKDKGGQDVSTLSCQGCHMSGRLGSPKPVHAGIPPIHFELMSCTACHSGPLPGDKAFAVQTALAHQLGLPSQSRHDDQMPGIRAPIYAKGADGLIRPYRIVWPAFWGYLSKDGKLTPINPDLVYRELRSTLRVRRNLQQELGDVRVSFSDKQKLLGADRARVSEKQLKPDEQLKLEKLKQQTALKSWNEKLIKALAELNKKATDGATAVFVAAGRAQKLSDDGKSLLAIDNDRAKPYMWPIAHDVRPARMALGAHGCTDCHSKNAPIFFSSVDAVGPTPDADPIKLTMYQIRGEDPSLLAAWDQSFTMRKTFKVVAIISFGVLVLVIAAFGLGGVGALLKWWSPAARGSKEERH